MICHYKTLRDRKLPPRHQLSLIQLNSYSWPCISRSKNSVKSSWIRSVILITPILYICICIFLFLFCYPAFWLYTSMKLCSMCYVNIERFIAHKLSNSAKLRRQPLELSPLKLPHPQMVKIPLKFLYIAIRIINQNVSCHTSHSFIKFRENSSTFLSYIV